nr:hypothetical protein [Tanacetum cinerariifolium]
MQGSSRNWLLPNSRLSLLLPKNLLRRVSELRELPKRPLLPLTTGVVMRDTSDKSVSKKKAPAKTGRGKGIDLLSDATLLEEAQMKKALKKSKRQTHNLQASGSSEGADFESEVPDEQTRKTKDTSERTGVKPGVPDVSKDDSSYNSEQIDSDDEENPSFTLKDYEEEEQDEEYVFSLEKEKSDDEEKMFEEEDNDVAKELKGQINASNESGFVQEKEDAHVTLTTVHDKTEGPLQSSSISFDFTSKLLNLDDPSPDINSMMNTLTIPPPPPLFDQRVSALETKVSEFNQTSQLAKVVSLISSIVDNYLASKLKEEVNVAVRLQSNKLKEEAEVENQEFINQVDSTIKKIIKEQEPEFKVADTELHQYQGIESGHLDDQPDNKAALTHDWFQKPNKPLTPDRAWNKSKFVDFRPPYK